MKLKKKLSGMTLVEMLIAMFIFALGIAAVTLLFSRSWQINSFVIEEGNATTAANDALQKVVKSLRKVKQADDGSYPIFSTANNDLVVYLDIDNNGKTERVHYYLDSNGNFKQGVTEPNGNPAAYPIGDQTVTTIAKYISNNASQPVFTYYNQDYPIDTTNNPLANPQPGDVRLIGVHFWVNIKPKTAPENVNLESFAELRNLND